MPRPRITPPAILALRPSQVKLIWGCSIPNHGLRECEIRLAKAAAAEAGFDEVIITGNIHATTSNGRRRAKPHLTVKFKNTRYGSRLDTETHIDVHVWSPFFQKWDKYPARRPANYAYEHVHQDGNVRYFRGIPKVLAEQELATWEQEQAEIEERQRQEEERRRIKQEEQRRKDEEKRLRQEEERRIKQEEQRRKDEEKRRREEERRRREEQEREARREQERQRREDRHRRQGEGSSRRDDDRRRRRDDSERHQRREDSRSRDDRRGGYDSQQYGSSSYQGYSDDPYYQQSGGSSDRYYYEERRR